MAFSGSQTTRHGLYGGPRSPYGSFAGKSLSVAAFVGAPVVAVVELNPVVAYGHRGTGYPGYAVFPAADDRLRDDSNAAALHSGDKTFTCGGWFRRDATDPTSARGLIGVGTNATGQRGWYIAARTSDGLIDGGVNADGTNWESEPNYISGEDLESWFLVFLEHHATEDRLRLWLNGTKVRDVAYSSGVVSGSGPLIIGAPDNGLHAGMTGAASRVGYWNRALTAAEHATLYSEGPYYAGLSSALKTDLVAWWDLTSESGTTWADEHGSIDLTDVTGDATVEAPDDGPIVAAETLDPVVATVEL